MCKFDLSWKQVVLGLGVLALVGFGIYAGIIDRDTVKNISEWFINNN